MENIISLSQVPVGKKGKVEKLLAIDLPRRRMLDLGIVPGTIIEVLRKSPLGDPTAYEIRGAMIALRKEESNKILVRLIDEE